MVEILHRRSTQVEAAPDALRVIIRYWFGWPVFAFMVFWTSFNVSQANWLNIGTDSTISVTRVFSVLGIAMMVWLVCGREAIVFDRQSIDVFRGIFGIGWHSSLSASEVHDMRVGSFLDPRAGGKWEPRFVRSSLVFEYRGKTQYLGRELGQLEAERIIKAIREWDPQVVYKPQYVPIDISVEVSHRDPSKSGNVFRSSGSTGPAPIALLLFGLWIIWGFGFQTVGARLNARIDGVVISSRDIPAARGPRYATEYALRGPDDQIRLYVAGSTDASLPRSMPTGTYLKKERWHLYYERNNRRIDDFPLLFYQVILGIALGCVVWSGILWQGQRHPK